MIVECPACKGAKQVPCEGCEGSGYCSNCCSGDCPDCEGRGSEDCWPCDGTGEIDAKDVY